ncbi:MAG TPA: hypothetical protein VGK59_18565 [Ohtaekwangia sp.]
MKPAIHKCNDKGFILCRTRKVDNIYIFGSQNESEITCKVCKAGGQSNFRKTKRPLNMTISNDLSKLIDCVNYEVNYVDYEKDQYTVPVILTRERAEKILDDRSIKKIRFTPILGAYMSFEFEPFNLVMTNENYSLSAVEKI